VGRGRDKGGWGEVLSPARDKGGWGELCLIVCVHGCKGERERPRTQKMAEKDMQVAGIEP
jgi:hypothetical protein